MTDKATESHKPDPPMGVSSSEGLGPLVERLRNTPNWMRESFGSWKDCVLKYDRAPFEAADELEALALQRDNLRDALAKVLDTHNQEAKAAMSYQNARENFSDSSDERKAQERAMLAACEAEREARVLLLTLRA
jgi:hypothetical protein